MKLIFAVGLTLASGFVQAAQPLEIPVEVIPVQLEQDQHSHWEEANDISHDKAPALVAAGEKAGGLCHELIPQKTVVCLFQGNRSVGIDWEKLSKSLGGVQQDIKSGTAEAAQAMAQSYLSDRFIVVAPPKVEGDQALVSALFMGEECTLNMSRTQNSQNGFGWLIYGSVCAAATEAEQKKWTADHPETASSLRVPQR
jgi:hypothetical protein